MRRVQKFKVRQTLHGRCRGITLIHRLNSATEEAVHATTLLKLHFHLMLCWQKTTVTSLYFEIGVDWKMTQRTDLNRTYSNFNLIWDYSLKHLHSQTTSMPECIVRQKTNTRQIICMKFIQKRRSDQRISGTDLPDHRLSVDCQHLLELNSCHGQVQKKQCVLFNVDVKNLGFYINQTLRYCNQEQYFSVPDVCCCTTKVLVVTMSLYFCYSLHLFSVNISFDLN